jgi:hypothetical protein
MTKCSLRFSPFTQNVKNLYEIAQIMYSTTNPNLRLNLTKFRPLVESKKHTTGRQHPPQKLEKVKNLTEWHGGHTFALMIANADCTSSNGTSSSSTSSSSVLKRASCTEKGTANFITPTVIMKHLHPHSVLRFFTQMQIRSSLRSHNHDFRQLRITHTLAVRMLRALKT